MTLGEMVEKLTREMAEEAARDEKKGEILIEIDKIVESAKEGYKIDGCKLFDAVHRLNMAFPDFTSAILAMSLIASFGVNGELVEFDDIFNLNVDDVITGAEIDGEED